MKFDDSHHYLECECGEREEELHKHNYEWIVDVEASYTVTGYRHKKCTICDYTTEENSPYEAEKNKDGTLKIDKKLTDALTKYLVESTWNFDFRGATIGQLIGYASSGERTPLLVELSENNVYYVCAYFNVPHQYISEEYSIYCCREEYTWVGFEKPEDIQESYNGNSLLVAFQINISDNCTNLLTGENEGVMEHFVTFKPEFVNDTNSDGSIVNIVGNVPIDTSFVYFTNKNFDRMFYCSDTYQHKHSHLDLVELDGVQYISEYLPLYTVLASGKQLDRELADYYGSYYDELLEIMITGKYQTEVENLDGTVDTNYYGIFRIDDFAKIIK